MALSRSGLRQLADDRFLTPYLPLLRKRHEQALKTELRLTNGKTRLADFASGHEFFGLHRTATGWVLREWAPNATRIVLTGTFSNWSETPSLELTRLNDHGIWEISLRADCLKHGDLYRLKMHWNGGSGDRIPAYARRVVQDENTKIFNAQVWTPPPFEWRHASPAASIDVPLIYETHVGMSQEKPCVGSFEEFRRTVLPRVVRAGYNTIQLMAILEHPYYGSFGYHVSSFFAVSSRFGTPEEFKALVDDAHAAGIAVIIDMVHSHAVMNEAEGLSRYDGTTYQFFHEGPRGYHVAWDSRCFDYGKPEVLHFLLSNCRFWLDEYRVDGFRFDGVTSMLYEHRGLGCSFTSYDNYFDHTVDEDAIVYLTLANKVIHEVAPHAMTIAEDVSGMPGLAAPSSEGGCGFDCRLAMGVPDCWFKLANSTADEAWCMGYLWRELTNRRTDERVVSYVECHDQALVGGKSMIFELIGADMYDGMRAGSHRLTVDRGIALHKMMRLATLATAGHGYLNFMGNEFGHPEWVDFPREGNHWSYHYARRQWSLRDAPDLLYRFLADFDEAMIATLRSSGILGKAQPRLLALNEERKTLCFERAGWVFAFNFHPSSSWTDFAVEIPSGNFCLALDTDDRRFGGHGHVAHEQRYFSQPVIEGNNLRRYIRLYLPSRVALVLKPI